MPKDIARRKLEHYHGQRKTISNMKGVGRETPYAIDLGGKKFEGRRSCTRRGEEWVAPLKQGKSSGQRKCHSYREPVAFKGGNLKRLGPLLNTWRAVKEMGEMGVIVRWRT